MLLKLTLPTIVLTALVAFFNYPDTSKNKLLTQPVKELGINCGNWLRIPNYNTQDYVSIGDLDITGNQITVEASFNADTNYFVTGTVSYDLVSKHGTPNNCNYLLRPVTAEITTTNGYFQVIACDYVPKKINHAALVYDGSTLKFYRNGYLMGSKPASGNLVTNDLVAKIGNYALGNAVGALKGYMNEVKIWNVARSQEQIRNYMNVSLPNPTAQTGLVAYYTFDDLTNKQGNAAWNGTLHGAATINNAVPDCGFVADSCGGVIQNTCSNWLKTPDKLTGVSIGELDITGNQLTVEAMCNAADIYSLSRALVSKHGWEANCNYFLCPDLAQITTSNGFFSASSPCSFVSNKTYHVAMVYNGISLKLYRNGFLMQEVPATGNLINNDWPATIGEYAYAMYYGNAGISNIFKGFINEVRIWNVARTQQEIKDYMNVSLPNPETQTGLLAYYTFDDLKNKQGNSLYDGTINGAATINNLNPNCDFVIDSCESVPEVPENPCTNWLRIPNYNTEDYVSIGDLDITGNQITVEASFSADTNYFVTGTVSYDLVSKHGTPNNCNYLLRPVTAEITTTNGYYQVVACDYIPKKINHAALVYDGASLKFYRNGYLMGSKPASGNLVTNDLVAKIGNFALGNEVGALKGYINEVRIWNVARTQQQIKNYMNIPLPVPSTQTGLVAYYTFGNLNNKQGNPAWNGILHGEATINNAIPDCNFVADSCVVPAPSFCDSWLKTPEKLTGVTIGELDITGNQLTVEAMCNASDIYDLSRALVSKHGWQANCNYFLCPDLAQITTSNGFFSATSPCGFVSNTTYHVAMVYNGSSLKLYRNGSLMQEVAASGNLVNNNWPATIGEYAYAMYYGNASISNIFKGYINEVRIWNIARTEDEIKNYMNTSLPNPATQTGLLAYYTFDDLRNKQGNSAYDGVLNGTAAIGTTNPNCSLADNPCAPEPEVCTATITASGETTFCAGGSVTLTASEGTNYAWSTGETTREITVSSSGLYFVTITNAENCTSLSKTVVVTVNPSPEKPVINAEGATTFCQGGSVTLTAFGTESYVWNTGETTKSIIVSSSGAYSAKAKNEAGCVSAASERINVFTKDCGIDYCTAHGINKDKGYINKVFFRGIANVSGWNDGYGDFTSLTGNVKPCNCYTIAIVPGFGQGCSNFRLYTRVWIDWNQDGDFDDKDELVFSPPANSRTVVGRIKVPCNAIPGQTRMRVAMRYGCPPSACGPFTFGEVEDYSISVQGAVTSNSNSNKIAPKSIVKDKTEAEIQFNIYPNPASNNITIIKNNSAKITTAVMNITDASGKLVMQKRITNTRETVDVSKLANGTYFIRINYNGKSTLQQVVVQH